MWRMAFLCLLVAVAAACNPGSQQSFASGGGGTGTPDNISAAAAPQPSGPTCADQIAAWRVRLTDYRDGEARRESTCRDLGSRQVELNDRYRSLRTKWAFTAPEIEKCMRKVGEEERKSCVEGLCVFIALGGYNCSDLMTPLAAIAEEQDQLYAEQRQQCCTAVLNSEVQQALAYPAPDSPLCTAPQPPAAPSCAATESPAASYATNGM